jgi:hypothetical protein
MVHELTTKQLRSFGLLVGGIFAAIGVWPVAIRGAGPRLWAVVLAAALVLPALVVPGSLRPVYRVWMAAGQGLGWVNTRIMLGVIFYGLFTPLGCVMRLLGKDLLRLRFEPDADTYRVVRQARPADHVLRQF